MKRAVLLNEREICLMSRKRHISIREFVKDFKSGLPDCDLMRKYGLSARGLGNAFQKLTDCGALTSAEIENRPESGDDTVFFKSTRVITRHCLAIPINVYEIGSYPETIGQVRDITDRGLGISGIDAEIGDEKTFSIFPNEFVQVQPLSFKAECKWIEKRPPGDILGGFQITEISRDNLQRLHDLIRELGDTDFRS